MPNVPVTAVDPAQWKRVRALVRAAFRTSLHSTLVTVARDGAPHPSPIGSVLLGEPGRAVFFEIFSSSVRRHAEHDDRVALLAVDSGRLFWLRSLWRGEFSRPPAVRLSGRVLGAPRPPTEEEVARWRRQVRAVRWTEGYRRLWGRLDRVRDLAIDRIEWIGLGAMTRRCLTET